MDGRVLALLAIAGLAGAKAVHGSRGVVRSRTTKSDPSALERGPWRTMAEVRAANKARHADDPEVGFFDRSKKRFHQDTDYAGPYLGRYIGVKSAHAGWRIYRVGDDGDIAFAGHAKDILEKTGVVDKADVRRAAEVVARKGTGEQGAAGSFGSRGVVRAGRGRSEWHQTPEDWPRIGQQIEIAQGAMHLLERNEYTLPALAGLVKGVQGGEDGFVQMISADPQKVPRATRRFNRDEGMEDGAVEVHAPFDWRPLVGSRGIVRRRKPDRLAAMPTVPRSEKCETRFYPPVDGDIDVWTVDLKHSLWSRDDEVWAERAPTVWRAMWVGVTGKQIADGHAVKIRTDPTREESRFGTVTIEPMHSGEEGDEEILEVTVLFTAIRGDDDEEDLYEEMFHITSDEYGFDEMMRQIDKVEAKLIESEGPS